MQSDPEDYFEEYSGGGQIYEIGKDSINSSPKALDQFIYEPIENIIMASLGAIKDCDARKKFANSILIVGGGAHMFKLTEHLMDKLNQRI